MNHAVLFETLVSDSDGDPTGIPKCTFFSTPWPLGYDRLFPLVEPVAQIDGLPKSYTGV